MKLLLLLLLLIQFYDIIFHNILYYKNIWQLKIFHIKCIFFFVYMELIYYDVINYALIQEYKNNLSGTIIVRILIGIYSDNLNIYTCIGKNTSHEHFMSTFMRYIYKYTFMISHEGLFGTSLKSLISTFMRILVMIFILKLISQVKIERSGASP